MYHNLGYFSQAAFAEPTSALIRSGLVMEGQVSSVPALGIAIPEVAGSSRARQRIPQSACAQRAAYSPSSPERIKLKQQWTSRSTGSCHDPCLHKLQPQRYVIR